jgi:hypothetical protein
VTLLIWTNGCGHSDDSEDDLYGEYKSKVVATQSLFYEVCSAIDVYYTNEGKYPENLDQLIKSEYGRRMLKTRSKYVSGAWAIQDTWSGAALKYVCPGQFWSDTFDLYSFGPNGLDDNGKSDDVTSWELLTVEKGSEGSRIYLINHDAAKLLADRLTRLQKNSVVE